ncbi:MAG TPA: RDD family protein [Vicinamibacterales bacterium]
MKCPKCGYLGFESGDRCRNCGYDFSLAPSLYLPELPIRSAPSNPNPLDDLSLVDAAASFFPTPPHPSDRPAPVEDLPARPPAHVGLPTPELPLFQSDDPVPETPLITRVSAPRVPLGVRRATPEAPRHHAEVPRTQQLDLSGEDFGLTIDKPTQPADRAQAGGWLRPDEVALEPAGIVSRVIAVVIDLALLAVIDIAVVYFTMQICGLTQDDVQMLPLGPLLAFLVLQNGGYFVAFTAGGQTMGKMATGIKVVAAETDESLDVGRSVLRTLVWAVLAVPAGLGFVTALFSRDHRGLHDRCAGTRVVRAAA